MKSLITYLLKLGYTSVSMYCQTIWFSKQEIGYKNSIYVTKDYKGYTVETAVITKDAIKESKYNVKTVKEVKQIIEQYL